MEKKNGSGLAAKSRKRLFKSAFFAILVFASIYLIGREAVDYLTVGSEGAHLKRESLKQEFEEYIRLNEVTAEDYAAVEAFRTEHFLRQLVVIREGEIVLYTGDRGGLFRSGDYDASTIKTTVEADFADGQALVYFGKTDNPALIVGLTFLSALIAILAGISYFSGTMQADVDYIRKLQKEVAVISRGDFDGHVTIEGDDEIAELARDLDRMRAELKARKTREAEMREAEEKLVLGMSHDLRTPLTALTTYLEIAKRQGGDGTKYLDRAAGKAEEIRELSDGMFEHFRVSSAGKDRELSRESAGAAFSDYLSEICAVLAEKGFSVTARGMEDLKGTVLVDYDYLGRIVNNLVSNFMKYADRAEEVLLAVRETENEILIRFENAVSPLGNGRESAGIGTKNIAIMMRAMGGALFTQEAEGRYVTELHFPKEGEKHGEAEKQDTAG